MGDALVRVKGGTDGYDAGNIRFSCLRGRP